jgi:hypothetical protein
MTSHIPASHIPASHIPASPADQPAEPAAHAVPAYPLRQDGRIVTGALVGPDSTERDQLLLGLCRSVVDAGGVVWCAEAWPHAAPAQLRELATTHFTALNPTVGGPQRRELAEEFHLLDLLIDTQAAATAAGDDVAPVLVVLYEADTILVEGLGNSLDDALIRLVRRGARAGVGFLLVTPTDNLHGDPLLGMLALDAGACFVLGSTPPVVLRSLQRRRRPAHGGDAPTIGSRPGWAHLLPADTTAEPHSFPLQPMTGRRTAQR